ncbi:MAG TPA: nuclear transport factor 2 family protein [Fontimonas sp.]
MKRNVRWLGLAALLAALSISPVLAAPPTAQEQVLAAERAFAQSMADRDLQAFSTFVADEAVFFGSSDVLRGKPAVIERWSAFFEGPTAPFSWAPDQVEVLASGTLAHSAGPVRDAQGKLVSRFNSVWRLEAPGVWRVIFDKGSPLSEAERKAADAAQ